nr:hypothetical protein [uncultured Butyrivibrio sp.]
MSTKRFSKIICSFSITLAAILILFGCGTKAVTPPFSFAEAQDMTVSQATAVMKTAGFEDISSEAVATHQLDNDGKIASIKIGNDSLVSVDTAYNPSTPVKITYYEYEEPEVVESTQTEDPTAEPNKTLSDADIEDALKNLNLNSDEFSTGPKFYFAKAQSNSSGYVNTDEMFHLVLQLDEDNIAKVYARVDYRGKYWVFYDKILFKVGDDLYTINVNRNDKVEETYASKAREQYIWTPTEDDMEMFEKIVENGGCKMRVASDTKHYDFEFTERTVTGTADILEAYRKLSE